MGELDGWVWRREMNYEERGYRAGRIVVKH